MDGVRNCQIRVDGKIEDALYGDLIAVEVAEREGEPSSFALQIAVYLRGDGSWTRLDEPPGSGGGFSPWQRITIGFGGGRDVDVIIDGYVAGVSPHIGANETESYLLVWGHDASYAMNVDDKVVAWPDQKYSDVAGKLFAAYGLGVGEVTDTKVVYAATDDLLMQHGTDWQLLKRLAGRVGYEVFVRGAKGYFRPPDLGHPPQKDLAAHFGPSATNMIWLEPRVTADQPSKISMARVNPVEKTLEKIDVAESPLKALGAKDANALRTGRSAAGKPSLRVPPEAVSSAQAMEALVKGVRSESDWIVTGEGEVDGVLYGQVLRAREPVRIKGIGKTFSGIYYVTEVVHRFTEEAYTQRFKVVRNGVGLTGRERFSHEVDAPVDAALQGSDLRVQVSSSGRVVSP